MAELACMVFEAASGLQKVLRLSSSDPNLGVTKSLFSSWVVAAFVTSRTGGQMSRWRLVFRFFRDGLLCDFRVEPPFQSSEAQ